MKQDKYFHILFEDIGLDLTLKCAWIRVEQVADDDYELGDYEFYLEMIDNLYFNEDTILRLYNDMLDVNYLCKVIKRYDDKLVLRIIEWQEW